MLLLQTAIVSTLLSLALACSNNNCLNAFNRAGASAKSFCATYTKGVSTATTALPTYATQCTNLPSKISSACSCIATKSSSTIFSSTFSTVTTSAAGTTCTPSVLQDTDFSVEIFGGPPALHPWEASINIAPGTTVLPTVQFMAASTNFFEADFSNFASDPYLTTVTLFQPNLHICPGSAEISYQYAATINAIAANPVPEKNNCTITSGLTGIPGSVFSNLVDWVTDVPPPIFTYFITTDDVGKAGVTAEFYITIECTLVDWWPRIEIMSPSLKPF